MKKFFHDNAAVIVFTFALLTIVVLGIVYVHRRDLQVTRGSGKMRPGSNDPMNIRATDTFWKGETTNPGDAFESFATMGLGYRAGFVLLYNYMQNGYNTIRKIITRYAPPSENDTAGYIKNVSTWTGIAPDAELSEINFTGPGASIIPLVAAISRQEQGVQADMKDVNDGYKLFRTTFLHLAA